MVFKVGNMVTLVILKANTFSSIFWIILTRSVHGSKILLWECWNEIEWPKYLVLLRLDSFFIKRVYWIDRLLQLWVDIDIQIERRYKPTQMLLIRSKPFTFLPFRISREKMSIGFQDRKILKCVDFLECSKSVRVCVALLSICVFMYNVFENKLR